MKNHITALVLSAMVAGCSQEASEPTTPKEETTDPFQIPRKFWGEYSDDLSKCGQPYDGIVKISWDTIQFWENRAQLASIIRISPDSVSVTTNNRGEGKTWTENYVLTLSGDGSSLEIASSQSDYGDEQHSMTRQRCSA